MDTLHHLMTGLAAAMSLQNLLFALIGCILGTLIGVLPGIGPAAGTAILIPLTFKLDPTGAIIMLAASTTAPCTAAPSPRCWSTCPARRPPRHLHRRLPDGASRAAPAPALGIAALGSFIGGMVATIVPVVVAPPLAALALIRSAGVLRADAGRACAWSSASPAARCCRPCSWRCSGC